MPRTFWRATCVACVGLAACHDSSGGDTLVLQPTNAGLSADLMGVRGDLAVLFSGEPDSDVNGDGDRQDRVVTLYHLGDGTRHVLPVALSPFVELVANGVLVVFGVSEAEHGETDLNEDGDTDDRVLFVFDDRTDALTNTHLAVAGPAPAIGDELVAFGVDELAQGSDLDGDGQLASVVLHVFDPRTGQSTSSGFPLTSSVVAGIDDVFGFTTTEVSHGDLNGDGDTTDAHIFEVFGPEYPAGVWEPVEVLNTPFALHEDWFVLVSEAGEGRDLNGDADVQDGVWFAVHPAREVAFLGASSLAALGSRVTGEFVTLAAQEIDGVDRNSDGDLDDALWVVHVPWRRPLVETGLSVASEPAFAAGFIAFAVGEESAGDLNGDGDVDDVVLELFDPSTDQLWNTRLSVFSSALDGDSRFVFPRFEGDDVADWNGDGDDFDTVFWTLDPVRGSVSSTGIASFHGGVLGVSAERLLFLALESDQGLDLNGDGDRDDRVYVVHVFAARRNVSLGLAATHADLGGLTPDGRAGLLVGEDAQGADLNEDGDRDDGILFVLE